MLRFGIRPGPRPYLAERYDALAKETFDRIEVRRMSPVLGAEIRGVDLCQPLDADTVAEIERAHHVFRVVFFRDQRLSPAQHLDFARRFGELEEHPFLPAADDSPEVMRFDKNDDVVGVENIWHSDVSWREIPSLGSVLRAKEVPDIGGDTLFSDMVAAYECLDDEVKEQIEGLSAVHDFTKSFGPFLGPEELAQKQKEFPPVEHPVVRTHPATGRKNLFIGRHASHIAGRDLEESRALLNRVTDEAAKPPRVFSHAWHEGDIAVWDNRCVLHRGRTWPSNQPRVMARTTIAGEDSNNEWSL